MRKTTLPRKTPTWQPATTRWKSPTAEWVGEAWKTDGGFSVKLMCVRSLTMPAGMSYQSIWYGSWLEVRANITLELQLVESGYYERIARIEKKDREDWRPGI